MKATTTNIDTLIVQLQQQDASLGDARDVPNTTRAQEAFLKRKALIARAISSLMNAPADLARRQAFLTDAEERRTIILTKRAEIEQAIADAPDWRTVRGARERDAAYDRQRDLHTTLQRLTNGQLFSGPGVCFERLADLDARIADLTKRRDRAQADLDEHVEAAKALLAAEPAQVSG